MTRLGLLSLTLALALAIAVPASGAPGVGTFTDVDDNIHEHAIESIAELGVTKGCNPPTNDRFCPGRDISRGEFAAFMARAWDLPVARGGQFEDVVDSVFEADISALATAGITRGCNPPANTRFCPTRKITRGEMAAFLVRALQLPEASEDYFDDDDGSVFEAEINSLAAAGITSGCDSWRYCPGHNLRRDEMASFLLRSLEGGGSAPPSRDTEDPLDDVVEISPGEDAQAIVDKHPAGTRFLLRSGVHRQFSVEPRNGNVFYGEAGTVLSGTKTLDSFSRSGGSWVARGQTQQIPFKGKCQSGNLCQMAEGVWIEGKELRQVASLAALVPGTFFFDYSNDAIYLADNPSGKLVEASVESVAFIGSADNVELRSLTIEKYASPAQSGAVQPSFGHDHGEGWLLSDVEIRFVHGAAVKLGTGMIVTNSNIHHNGWMGIHGSSGFSSARVEKSKITHNCNGGFQCFGWGGGGIKVGQGSGVTVVSNLVAANHGKGIHLDNGMDDGVIQKNQVVDNDGVGVMVELSSNAVIEGNEIVGNGHHQDNGAPGAGAAVLSSTDVVIRSNVLAENGHGVVLRRTSRGPIDRIDVTSNDISMTTGVTGVYDDTGMGAYSAKLVFSQNHYHLGSKTKYYYWNGAQRTAAEWRSYGNDNDGTWE